jgi:hypothetical protein
MSFLQSQSPWTPLYFWEKHIQIIKSVTQGSTSKLAMRPSTGDDCELDVDILLGGLDRLSAVSYSEFNALPRNIHGQRMSAASLPHFAEGGRCQACVFHRKTRGTCRLGALCFFCHADHAPIARVRRRPPRSTPSED